MGLHVLQVIESAQCQPGSPGVFLRFLCEAMNDHGHQLSICATDACREENGQRVAACVQPGGEARDVLAAADLVHIHGWGYGAARWAAREARARFKPWLNSPYGGLTIPPGTRNAWWHRLKHRFSDDRLIQDAGTVLAVNRFEADSMVRFGSAVSVAPWGIRPVDPSARECDLPEQAPPDGSLLLVLAPIDPVEGCVLLLKAFAEVGPAAADWRIALVGPEVGHWRQSLEPAIRRKGGVDRVVFAQAPDLRSQRAWLARADLLASPALHPRPPVAVLQAIAAGVPVVATPACAPDGMASVIHVCEPSRSMMARTLRRVMEQTSDERAEFGRRAAAALSDGDQSHPLIGYEELYGRLAGNGKG